MNEIEAIRAGLEIEMQQATRAIIILKQFAAFPELPLYISRPGVNDALECPLSERGNLVNFLIAVWEREMKRAQYFAEKYKAMERGNNEAGI